MIYEYSNSIWTEQAEQLNNIRSFFLIKNNLQLLVSRLTLSSLDPNALKFGDWSRVRILAMV